MKWIGIAGSRLLGDDGIEHVVRQDIKSIFQNGNAIVSGGGLGVDYIAVDEALKHDPRCARIKVILPAPLRTYHEYFNYRVTKGRVTEKQVDALINQLERMRAIGASCLVEMQNEHVNRKAFHARNTMVVESSDELQAYKAYQSSGTQNAIDTARRLKKPVKIYEAPISP